MQSIWDRLPKPFLALAPMHGATDTVFRQMVVQLGRPDIMFTEFVSTDGLCSKGFDHVAKALAYTATEKPLIAQIWGNKPEYFYKASQEVVKLGFDGLDINMSCPVRAVVSKGCGAYLSQDHALAIELIKACQKGVAGSIPVSVKIRLGLNQIEIDQWANTLLGQNIEALTLHARTAKDMSKVPAQHDYFGRVVEIRNKLKSKTKIIGNGDITSRIQAEEVAAKYDLDGVMIGRGVFANPWVFSRTFQPKTPLDKLSALKEHLELFAKTYSTGKIFARMKRFTKIYIKGFKGAKKLEQKLVVAATYQEFEQILDNAINYYTNLDQYST